jgi:hypothetical protein
LVHASSQHYFTRPLKPDFESDEEDIRPETVLSPGPNDFRPYDKRQVPGNRFRSPDHENAIRHTR